MSITFKIKEFFKEVWVEMKRVSWLSQKDITRYTMIVLGVVIASAIFLGALDYLFTTLLKIIVLK